MKQGGDRRFVLTCVCVCVCVKPWRMVGPRCWLHHADKLFPRWSPV